MSKIKLFKDPEGLTNLSSNNDSLPSDLYETRRKVHSDSTTLQAEVGYGNCSASGSCYGNCAMLSFSAQTNANSARDDGVQAQANYNGINKK